VPALIGALTYRVTLYYSSAKLCEKIHLGIQDRIPITSDDKMSVNLLVYASILLQGHSGDRTDQRQYLHLAKAYYFVT
jgi:hypothetical protein